MDTLGVRNISSEHFSSALCTRLHRTLNCQRGDLCLFKGTWLMVYPCKMGRSPKTIGLLVKCPPPLNPLPVITPHGSKIAMSNLKKIEQTRDLIFLGL